MIYEVLTRVPVWVRIDTPDPMPDGSPADLPAEVVRVTICVEEIPSTLQELVESGGEVFDETGSPIERVGDGPDGPVDHPDWGMLEKAYTADAGDGVWPAWEIGW